MRYSKPHSARLSNSTEITVFVITLVHKLLVGEFCLTGTHPGSVFQFRIATGIFSVFFSNWHGDLADMSSTDVRVKVIVIPNASSVYQSP